jgi:hypothetical protein
MKFDYKKYPLFGFRVDPCWKNALESRLNALVKKANKEKSLLTRKFSKRDVFTRALCIGFTHMEQEK